MEKAMTVDELQGYMTKFRGKHNQVPVISCQDGFQMSVQASESHYCEPKQNHGPWSKVEIGYPKPYEPALEQWHDMDNIYVFVPIEVVCEVIEKHGGVNLDWDYYKII
jgi:hypothetical protein